MQNNIIIQFEDHGQDFLRWEVDPKGNIVQCKPAQFGVWKKWEVINPSQLKVGGLVRIQQYRGKEQQLTVLTIKYRIVSIKKVENEPVKA